MVRPGGSAAGDEYHDNDIDNDDDDDDRERAPSHSIGIRVFLGAI